MKFTIEDTSELVALEGDVGATLCRVFTGTADNGAVVRFAVAHCAVADNRPGWKPVREYFSKLDDEATERARAGQFLVQSSDTETVEPRPPIEA